VGDHHKLNIVGVVLAGGLSSRMGQDKALLELNNRTLLARSIALLESVGLTACYVSGDYPGFNCILDQQPTIGPIGGLSACVNTLHNEFDAMLVIPVDMPLLSVDDCAQLLERYTKQAEDQQGLYYQDVMFPMLLALNNNLVDYLAEFVLSQQKKHRSLYRLLNALDAQVIKPTEQQFTRFKNTNTPEQWQHLLSRYQVLRSNNVSRSPDLTKQK